MDNPNKYDEALEFAKQLADEAKEIALKYYKNNPQYTTKIDKSPVTIADEEINQLVIDKVKERFPDYGILGEEQSWQQDRDLLWVCDPIDGTIPFSMGEPIFYFSIALVENGIPIVAVTKNLALGDTFWAIKGKGAYLNNNQIHVSSRDINNAWFLFPANLNRLLSDDQIVYKRIADVLHQNNIVHGSVNKGMLLAQGLSDGTIWFRFCHPWDVAAVKLIVEEAGGKFTGIHGEEQRFDDELDGAIMSNGVIHDDLIKIINNE